MINIAISTNPKHIQPIRAPTNNRRRASEHASEVIPICLPGSSGPSFMVHGTICADAEDI